jgi:hypothetical protein
MAFSETMLLKNTGIFTISTLLFPVATPCEMHIYGSVGSNVLMSLVEYSEA